MKAPQFSLQDQNGNTHSLGELKGTWVVLYFYPKDDTPGCTTEACSFRDGIHEFEKRNVVVLGVSKDSVASHKKFADKFKLNFPLLSDESTETIKAFGAWGEKSFAGKKYMGIKRNTYLINPAGEIVKSFENVNPLTHTHEIIKFLEEQKL